VTERASDWLSVVLRIVVGRKIKNAFVANAWAFKDEHLT
jgi:hypothetical protein